jgi:hypothetical protein
MTNYQILWKSDKDELSGKSRPLMTHLAGMQTEVVKPDDTVWIVNNEIRFSLIGKIEVLFVTSDAEEAKRFLKTNKLFQEKSDFLYVIAKPYTVEQMQWIDISHIASELRYDSENDRLDVANGTISSQQLRRRRKLTEVSGELLRKEWYTHVNQADLAKLGSNTQIDSHLSEDDAAYASKFVEGGIVTRTVQQRIRNQQLVRRAKEHFRATHEGRLYCEACGFDYQAFYGIDYIEAHHTKAISSLNAETETDYRDLVMLCANCHRAIHSRTQTYSIEELHEMIKRKS